MKLAIKVFSQKQNLREYVTTRFSMNTILNEHFGQKEYNPRWK